MIPISLLAAGAGLWLAAATPSPSPAPKPPSSPAASPSPAPRAKEFRIDRWDWTGEAGLSAALRRMVVRNDYGDVRARFAGDGLVNVHAVIQRLGSDPDVGVNVERHGDTLAVTVVSPPGRLSVEQAELSKTAVDRVDLVVYVPAQAALDAESLRGMVEARGLKSDIRAVTGDGDIRVSTSAAVEARSRGGAVTVSMGRDGTGPRRVESESGALWVSLPAEGDFSLQVEAGGELSSEIELKPGAAGAGAPRTGRAILGQGTRPIVVRSGGRVEIRRAR
jgi:hypothetical protein